MPRFFNNDVFNTNNNMNNGFNNGMNNTMNQTDPATNCCQTQPTTQSCGCQKPQCPTIYKECPPIVTCSKQTLNQYHITKQPYIHNYVTEVVHHHVLQNEFIPKYSCYEVHVNEPTTNN